MTKRFIYLFLALWCAFIALMTLQKPLFMLFEPGYEGLLGEITAVMWHGLSMDISMASYLVAPVLLWLIARIWVDRPWMSTILKVWLWIAGSVVAIASVLDASLYPFWGCRLDATPLFYFMTSPGAAFASLPWWANLLLLILMAALAFAFGFVLTLIARKLMPIGTLAPLRKRIFMTVGAIVLGGAMIIPIRGGVTVSTMSPGRAFFSDNMALNNAAVNPLFNFVYSLSHSDDLRGQFRFFDDTEATRIFQSMYAPVFTEDDAPGDTLIAMPRLTVEKPNVYLVILESFSAHLMPSLGGENIAPNLDSLGREGILFTNFYAESFRTDRGVPAVISGFPAQPTTSMLRFVNKFSNVPSLATAVRPLGYHTNYYYGGDINFTNTGAYLVASGFENIISDKDFPISKRLSKWGAHDEEVFSRLLDDIAKRSAGSAPQFTVLQTSSSHEPYEVPFSKFENKRANAFAYTDKCIKDFTDALKASGEWDRSLIVFVPDHWGCYPENNKGYESRHHIPLIITGGAIDSHGTRIDRLGSQSGIAATVASLLGADTAMFPLSRNLFDTSLPEWAWISEPAWFGLVTPSGLTVIDAAGSATLESSSDKADIGRAKAFVQKLYDDLDAR